MLLNANSSGKPRHVTLRLIRRNSHRLRAVTATVLFCAVALAVGLSAAPQLYKWLHKMGDRPNHECAATLMSSGSVEHSACAPIATEPRRPPDRRALPAQGFPRVIAELAFSLLEHARPARS